MSDSTSRRVIGRSMMGGFDGANDERAPPDDSASTRTSISSASLDNSRYSTPLTTAPGTPVASFNIKDENTTRSTRTSSKLKDSYNALEPATKRQGGKAFSSAYSSRRRPQSAMTDGGMDMDEDDEEDNSRDAKLARRLQDEEYSKMDIESEDDEPFSSRLSRSANGKQPATTAMQFSDMSDLSDLDTILAPRSSGTPPARRARFFGGTFGRQKEKRGQPKNYPASDEENDSDDSIQPPNKKAKLRSATNEAVGSYSMGSQAKPKLNTEDSVDTELTLGSALPTEASAESEFTLSDLSELETSAESAVMTEEDAPLPPPRRRRAPANSRRRARNAPSIAARGDPNIGGAPARRSFDDGDDDDMLDFDGDEDPYKPTERQFQARARLEEHHPELRTMWKDLEDLPSIPTAKIEQPKNINRTLKPFQLEGVNWMQMMEKTQWGGGLLGDEMGMGKTIQAVSLIMSDYPQPNPSLVLIPPVAIMQWQQEIEQYTDGTLKTLVYHGTNAASKNLTVADLKKYDVILMSYNSLESIHRFETKGRQRKNKDTGKMENVKSESVIHAINYHRVILDEAHNIKTRTTGAAKACFALKANHKWCLSGTPLQNRIGEFFSLVRFLNIQPFASYFCRQCKCSHLEWNMNTENRCTRCNHHAMQHVSVFNQELLNPIQKFGNAGPGAEAFRKLRLLTDRFMLRRVKTDHSAAMELPAKEIYVDRKFFGEEENDFAGSIMSSGTRKFETYVAQGVLLNNYANIFGLIMQMRQVADHPDLILKRDGAGGQNILVCCVCDEPAEDAVRSVCKHEFCRSCVRSYIRQLESEGREAECPRCHIGLSIDLEQPEIVQDEEQVKKTSIINRINMSKWTSSSKIEALVYELHLLRSKNQSHKSIIFSSFTTMLQLVEWRLRRAGITTVMLDGSMTPAQRQASINAFMTDPDIECFLVSLKAGGVALNLTEASKVFLVDPWWNPAAEWQSADRCHRIGQNRPCTITRLCIEDSVESRMVQLQEKKSNMIRSTINNDSAAMESLTPEDMQFLFRGS